MHSSPKEIVFACLAIAFVVLFPHTGLLPMFTYSIPVLVLIWFYQKKSGENFSDIGFRFQTITWKAAWVGSITGIVIFYFLQSVFFPLLAKFVPLAPSDLTDFGAIRHNIYMYVFVVAMGWLIGGLYEEIVFHGFIFHRLERFLPHKTSTPLAVGVTAIIFALYHFQLGTSGVINAFLAGLGYHLVMLRFQRNIWYAFFAHGTFDTLALTYIYLGIW